jgi:hypothetical protein
MARTIRKRWIYYKKLGDMSENINDMDTLLNEKISAMKFEFKDAYWAEMEVLLDQQKSKKGFFWWIFGSTTIALLTLSLFWIYVVPTNQYSSERVITQQTENIETFKSNSEMNTTDLKNQKNDHLNSVNVEKEEQIKTNSSAQVTTSPKSNRNKIASSNKAVSSNVDKLSYTNSVTVATKTNQKSEKNELAQNSLEKKSISNLIAANEHQIQPDELAKTSKNEVIVQQKERSIESSNQLAHSTTNASIIAPGVDQMPILPFPSLNKNLLIPSSPIELAQRKPLMTHSFFAEAGIGYGANRFSKLNFGGEKVHLGFVYQLEKANWGLKTGLNVSWTSVNGLNYFSSHKIYGFSSRIVSNQLNYRSLTNLNIPLEATYHIKKHTIGLGVQLNVLLTTASKSRNWSDAQMNTKLEWNYRENLKPVSLAAVFDYTYNITKRWNIGAAFSYSITPILVNEQRVFSNQLARMFSGQLFIQYKLNFFKR